MRSEELFSQLESTGVLAVLTIQDAADAVPLAEALLAGGIGAMELTLRTDAAIDAMKAIAQSVPDMVLGAGTVLTVEQLRQVAAAGAHFAVSPGVNPRVVEAAGKEGIPFSPGVMTPSDVEAALELGCRRLKFFPAEQSGGLPYLRSMAAPYDHLGIKYIPLGGVGPKNLAEYLNEPRILAVGGSWLAPQDLIATGNWERIRSLAQAARKVVDGLSR